MITTSDIQRHVEQQGFSLVGVLPVEKSRTAAAFESWVDDGMHGTMDWIAREDAVEKRKDPRKILKDAQSVITLGFSYTPQAVPQELLDDPSRGIIARYAWYDDYHKVLKKRLIRLGKSVHGQILEDGGPEYDWKAYVDTGPFLERDWANRAGLGFVGRNSMLINFQKGSYVFLAEILTAAPLPHIIEKPRGGCANCTSCVDKCPTQAIVADRTIDARRCIAYLTIELRESIPEEFRPLMKNRIFGCDICQEVCPWNGHAKAVDHEDYRVREDLIAPPLEQLLFFDDEAFNERFRGSPIRRAKRHGFMRNVAIALGNWGTADAERLLREIQQKDDSVLVQEHVEWALKQCK